MELGDLFTTVNVRDGQVPEFPLDLIPPPSDDKKISLVFDGDKIVKNVSQDYVLIPTFELDPKEEEQAMLSLLNEMIRLRRKRKRISDDSFIRVVKGDKIGLAIICL